MFVNACLSARTWSRVALGIFANASLVGANRVMSWALLSVSTRPAFVTAVTNVDRAGACEAAVATGSSAMAARLRGRHTGAGGPERAASDAGDALGAGELVVSPAPLPCGSSSVPAQRPARSRRSARRRRGRVTFQACGIEHDGSYFPLVDVDRREPRRAMGQAAFTCDAACELAAQRRGMAEAARRRTPRTGRPARRRSGSGRIGLAELESEHASPRGRTRAIDDQAPVQPSDDEQYCRESGPTSSSVLPPSRFCLEI